ncbi:MAG: PEP-CTERM sorting domain-containing protein [Bryobacteraceae bacterium]|nr:PEP-CTERM sorting domain-containing protein [Bryobacteraceae bacterium]
MNTKTISQLFAPAALLLISSAVSSAAPIATLNNINWFAEQGKNKNGTTITDPQRNDPMSIFNPSDNKWLSLGFVANSNVGGRVYGTALDGFILSGTFEVRETTFGVNSANYPEGVRLTFSGSLSGASDIVLNLNQTPASCTPGLICSTAVLNSGTTQWLVSGFDSFAFKQVEVADITRPLLPAKSTDGFDLGYINATTSAVPEPSSFLLMTSAGAALVGLARKFKR